MSWATALILHTIAMSLLAIAIRLIALHRKQLFFTLGLGMYSVVAVMGVSYGIFFTGSMPSVPPAQVWGLLVGQAVFISTAWLLQFKVISRFGASNGIIFSTLNVLATVLVGVFIFGDPVSWQLGAGAVLIVLSVLAVYRLSPGSSVHAPVPLREAVPLIGGMMLGIAGGISCEKAAIDALGVWQYVPYGWSMQCVAVIVISMIFGRTELRQIRLADLWPGLLLGVIVAIGGGLFVYSLGNGPLSSTILATSGKVALTMMLAAWLLGEHNGMSRRLVALLLACAGVWLVIG